MFNLAEYRNRNSRLADFLPWAALVGHGIVLNKDGSFQRTAQFRGPDLDSAVPAELVAVAGRLNNAFRRLGSGWAIFVEADRHAAAHYPDCRFPDAASALVDAERKADFEEAGAHFESAYFLTICYLPPAEDASRAETWLYEGREHSGIEPFEVLNGFADRTDRILRLIETFMPECRWLDDAQTLTYLHGCVSTKRHRVRVPETPMYLDALLADQPLIGGLEPRLGASHLRVLTITGFPTATTPGLLDELNRLAFPYRWATRAILLDKTDATKLLTKIRRQWFAKRKSVAAILKEVMTNEASVLVDTDAANKAADADLALQELGADYAGMAYVTATVTVWDTDPRAADEKLRLVEKIIQGRDFTASPETINAVDAWLGSTLFSEFTAGFGGTTPTIDDAMAIVLAALSLLGLGIFGPGIANGIVSGGPQLGAGAAIGTGLAAGGVAVAGAAAAGAVASGGTALAGGAAAAARGGATLAGGASRAYSLGAAGQSGVAGVASGLGNVASTGAQAAASPFKRAASKAVDSLKSSYQSGANAAAEIAGATTDAEPAAAAATTAAAEGQPDWAKRMKRNQQLSQGVQVAAHAVKSGDSHGGGASINLSESD